jgi:hypothetical protein
MTIWAIARYDLHLGEDEFWHMHPSLFHSLMDRLELNIEREDIRFARACLAINNGANSLYIPDADIMTFMPHKETQRSGGNRAEQILEKVKAAQMLLESKHEQKVIMRKKR